MPVVSSEMEHLQLGSESTSDSSDSVDTHEVRAVPFGSTEVNMTNCHVHCRSFFRSCETIHFNQLIANWMMAGYLGPVEEAYQKGLDVLYDLIYEEGVLEVSDGENGTIQFAESALERPIRCKHRGLCVKENLGFVDLLNLGKLGLILLADGIRKQRKVACSRNHIHRNDLEVEYVSHFNPMPNSLQPLLGNAKNLTGLLLRGTEFVPQSTFPFEILRNLTVLEISGSSSLTTIRENTISRLPHLLHLNLSDLLIESLPSGFFSQFFLLRCLILRGCSKLGSLPAISSSRLEVLDLSHCTALQKIASISTASLHMIDLSYTALASIHYGLYNKLTQLLLRDSNLREMGSFESAESLQVLDLSGASQVKHIGKILALRFEVLDLSRTQFESLDLHIPSGFESRLRRLILQECTSLIKLPPMKTLPYLEVLDISGCAKLELPNDLSNLRNLKELNLSRTNVKNFWPFPYLTSLSKLLLRDLVLDSLETLTLPSNLEELDLKGLKISSLQEFKSDFLEPLHNLQILNLSQTSVAELPYVSKLVNLRELILADCQYLEVVPDLQALINLEVLDLSLENDYTVDFQTGIEIEPQRVISFSAASSLQKLVLTNRSGVQKLFPLRSISNLEFLDLRGTDVRSIPSNYMEQIKCILLPAEISSCEVRSSQMGSLQEVITCDDNPQGRFSKPVEIHIVSTPGDKSSSNFNQGSSSNQPSALDRFKYEFTRLDSLISEMQSIKSSTVTGTTTANEDVIVESTVSNINNQTSMLEMLHFDLKYIQKNIDRYKSSRNYKTCEELLQELIDATNHLTAADFLADSTSFMRLFRIVVKLKLLIPPPKEEERPEVSEITKKKKEKPWFKRNKNKQKAVDIASSSDEWPDLCSSYESLTNIQKKCLLCFAVFPFNDDNDNNTSALKYLVIKKRMLFYWWCGEGFINPCYEEGIPPKEIGVSMNMLNHVSQQISLTEGETNPRKIEDIGEQVSKVLTEKGFIEPVMKKGRATGNCRMRLLVHSFITMKAKEESFFDFNPENGMLAPHFTLSRRACLLKSQDNCPSSCKLWADYNCIEDLKSFGNVRTLLNVNDCLVDIKSEWFSKMKCLSVLLLGSWRYDDAEHIEIENQTFLEELKNMKQLRVLSLQGLLTIRKLPVSVCKLPNLIILDLRECSYMEELPTDIGSLKSLTHLDITNCRLLTKMPKGIRLLSKLEVLKGFVITNQGSDPQNRKLCILEDLLNLKKLKKLSIIVNRNIFPDHKELQVLKGMENLRKLKILWEKDFNIAERSQSQPKGAITEETSRLSKLKKLKCWGHQSDQDEKDDTLSNEHLGNLEKLELWCFPCETAPHWLDPSELKKLEKLYIVGGSLNELRGGTNQNKWSVTTLRLKYLPNLHIRWRDLEKMFPNLTYMEKYRCPKLVLFPCDEEGVWIHDSD